MVKFINKCLAIQVVEAAKEALINIFIEQPHH